MGGACWTQQEGRPLVGRGTGLQPPDLLGASLRQPTHHGPQPVGQQGLFGDPQPLLRRARVQADHLVGRQALLGQARQMRHEWGRHQQDMPAGGHHLQHGWQQQAPFGLTRLNLQQLADGARGPAAAGQLGVEGAVPAGPAAMFTHAQQVPRPDDRSQVRRQAVTGVLDSELRR